MKATVKAPGTCGELVQGTIDGYNFHITCPINRYSYVTVELDSQQEKIVCNQDLPKTIEAVKRTLDYFAINGLKGQIRVESELMTSKGMASSTADITAAILATAVALGEEITLEAIGELALSIEPTDGLFYEGIALFDHVNGHFAKSLGQISEIGIVMLDLGGKINTLQFNNRTDLEKLNRVNEPVTKQALNLVKNGIKQNDLQLIGKGSTLSSKVNQKILNKQYFDKLLQFTKCQGILGLNVAHSGSLIGILYNLEQVEAEEIEFKVKQKIANLTTYRLKLINGGLEVVKSGLSQGRKYKYG